jgi:aminoglycoside phosphotransferase (APT) family kinase protein
MRETYQILRITHHASRIMNPNLFSADTLTSCIRPYLPGIDKKPTFTPIPTGKFNTSYFVQVDGQEFVLRIAPPKDVVFVFYERNMMWQEPGIHSFLLQYTSVPVAKILVFDDSHRKLPRDLILMERLPGEPLSSTLFVDQEQVLRQVGTALAQTHQLTKEQYGYVGEHTPMLPQPTWIEAFQIMWHKLIENVATVGYYSDEECHWLLKLLERHLPLFNREVPASLLHMDVWGQNILVDSIGNLTGLVDWDRALWGDPEIEFAVLDYCGISQSAFWEGYGQERDQSNAAQIRNLFYLLYELQKYIVIRHGRNHDPASARQYKQQVVQLVRRYFT